MLWLKLRVSLHAFCQMSFPMFVGASSQQNMFVVWGACTCLLSMNCAFTYILVTTGACSFHSWMDALLISFYVCDAQHVCSCCEYRCICLWSTCTQWAMAVLSVKWWTLKDDQLWLYWYIVWLGWSVKPVYSVHASIKKLGGWGALTYLHDCICLPLIFLDCLDSCHLQGEC